MKIYAEGGTLLYISCRQVVLKLTDWLLPLPSFKYTFEGGRQCVCATSTPQRLRITNGFSSTLCIHLNLNYSLLPPEIIHECNSSFIYESRNMRDKFLF
jgi:hypothetical protein